MVVLLTLDPSTAMLLALAEPRLTAPSTFCTSEALLTAVLELVSDLLETRLATVLLAELLAESTSCEYAALFEAIALLLLAEFDAEALIDALFALVESASCSPFEDDELAAAFFELVAFDARLAFAAELSDALAFSALLDASAALLDFPALVPV